MQTCHQGMVSFYHQANRHIKVLHDVILSLWWSDRLPKNSLAVA